MYAVGHLGEGKIMPGFSRTLHSVSEDTIMWQFLEFRIPEILCLETLKRPLAKSLFHVEIFEKKKRSLFFLD